MAVSESDLAELERALRDAGYGRLVDEARAEVDEEDLDARDRFEQLLELLETAVIPAVRARAASIRLLTRVEVEYELADVQTPGEAVRVPLAEGQAEALEQDATVLEELLAQLRAQIDADKT